jgi:hypothetical protein
MNYSRIEKYYLRQLKIFAPAIRSIGRISFLAGLALVMSPLIAPLFPGPLATLVTGISPFSAILVLFVGLVLYVSPRFLRNLLLLVDARSVTSPDEVAAASERSVATTADILTRDFQVRMQKEIDAAVRRLAATSDKVITSQLAARIDATVGANLVAVLGDQLARQTSAQHTLNDFKQLALDSFVQMRSRAIQYADSAQRQSSFFRWTAIGLSLGGLVTLALVLYQNYQQFMAHPELLQTHADWTMIILRNGPAYTFVLLCESLALIMFRYQSKSLEYMRYFSNEGTNLDARRIAFMSALFYDDKAAMKKLIEKLESTERNFLIDKNQRTLELANNDSEDRIVGKVFERFSKATSELPNSGNRIRGGKAIGKTG